MGLVAVTHSRPETFKLLRGKDLAEDTATDIERQQEIPVQHTTAALITEGPAVLDANTMNNATLAVQVSEQPGKIVSMGMLIQQLEEIYQRVMVERR